MNCSKGSDLCLSHSDVCPVEGQVFSTCARACTFTCDNVNELVCITLCTTGCDCPGGQVIDTELSKCVPVEECPASKLKMCSNFSAWVQDLMKYVYSIIFAHRTLL